MLRSLVPKSVAEHEKTRQWHRDRIIASTLLASGLLLTAIKAINSSDTWPVKPPNFSSYGDDRTRIDQVHG